jgi:hypothetical protein
MCLIATLSTNDAQHYAMLGVVFYCYFECRYAEHHYAECLMLSVVARVGPAPLVRATNEVGALN